jgi:hypothetical protein
VIRSLQALVVVAAARCIPAARALRLDPASFFEPNDSSGDAVSQDSWRGGFNPRDARGAQLATPTPVLESPGPAKAGHYGVRWSILRGSVCTAPRGDYSALDVGVSAPQSQSRAGRVAG